MVDMTEAGESKYINADLIKSSPTKIVIPIDAGTYEKGDWGMKFSLKVELDGKTKVWSPNQKNAAELIRIFGKDSKALLGKKILLAAPEDKVIVMGEAK